jgi:mono/diheme cytochrome c family protein
MLLLPAARARMPDVSAVGSPGWRAFEAAAAADTAGRGLYELGCASCHGADGGGAAPGAVAFDMLTPDFGDCSFASREPDADWLAVVHQGGPVRGFASTMPAFGEAFTEEQILEILSYVRTFCADASWPRGELNLPRTFFTEKAYPEDEAVNTVSVGLEGAGRVVNEVLYEKRFGSRNQVEIKVPFGVVEQTAGNGWEAGLSDIEVGLKRTMYHSISGGSIFALGIDASLPTGRESVGLGKGVVVVEPYASFGQIVAESGFFQLQGIVEVPAKESSGEETEALWRGAAGWTFTQGGGFGRTWTPMLEVLGARELDSGGRTAWDLVPQLQVSLNTRQHVLLNAGVRLPLTDADVRSSQLLVYVLWDWFDGGFFAGW